MSEASCSFGARLVKTPASGISGCRKSVEFTRWMPSFSSILATPPMSESVFLVVREKSSLASFQSGLMVLKILLCLTWPAITACVTPSWCRASMALLSSPRLTQWMRLVVSASSGEASSLMAMTAMSMTCWRAPSRTRNGKRPLPAIRPHPAVESVAVASALEAASDMAERVEGTLFDDAALGGFNELDEFLHIRGVAERFLHFLEGLRGVEFGAQQQAVGAFQRVQTLGRESFALQANSVDAVAG